MSFATLLAQFEDHKCKDHELYPWLSKAFNSSWPRVRKIANDKFSNHTPIEAVQMAFYYVLADCQPESWLREHLIGLKMDRSEHASVYGESSLKLRAAAALFGIVDLEPVCIQQYKKGLDPGILAAIATGRFTTLASIIAEANHVDDTHLT